MQIKFQNSFIWGLINLACLPIVFVRAHKLFWDLIDQIQNIFFTQAVLQHNMIMGIQGFVKTRIKSKHSIYELIILYNKYKLQSFIVDKTLSLSVLPATYTAIHIFFSFKRFWRKIWNILRIFFKKNVYSLSLSKHTEYYFEEWWELIQIQPSILVSIKYIVDSFR